MRSRPPLVLTVLLVGAVAAAVATANPPKTDPADKTTSHTGRRAAAGGERGVSPYWRVERKLVAALRREGRLGAEVRTLRRQLAHRLHGPSVTEAINLAATVYGYQDDLWRKARCETGGSFSPRAYNASSGASGLLQFLPSTWASTPFAGFSIWSPYANALAAGWMHAHHRGNEWSCR